MEVGIAPVPLPALAPGPALLEESPLIRRCQLGSWLQRPDWSLGCLYQERRAGQVVPISSQANDQIRLWGFLAPSPPLELRSVLPAMRPSLVG
jgi:hypothetical protein